MDSTSLWIINVCNWSTVVRCTSIYSYQPFAYVNISCIEYRIECLNMTDTAAFVCSFFSSQYNNSSKVFRINFHSQPSYHAYESVIYVFLWVCRAVFFMFVVSVLFIYALFLPANILMYTVCGIYLNRKECELFRIWINLRAMFISVCVRERKICRQGNEKEHTFMTMCWQYQTDIFIFVFTLAQQQEIDSFFLFRFVQVKRPMAS